MRTVAFFVLCCLLALAMGTVVRAPHRFAEQDRDHVAVATSTAHLMGTDELGRDRAARVSLSFLLALGGACCASAIASFLASTLGYLSAISPRAVSAALLYAADLSMTLPWLFLLMLVRAALPLNLPPLQSEVVTYLSLALLGVPVFLRTHGERASRVMTAEWMLQARAAGLRGPQLGLQLWPHVRPLLWTQFLLYVPACVIAEANLGTMGLGLSDPLPSLGTFLANLPSEVLLGSSSLVFLPVAILVAALVALELSIFGAKP